MRFAFDLARTRTVKKVSSVTKSNAQQYGMVLWDDVFKRVALDYPDVETESVLVDAMSALEDIGAAAFALEMRARRAELIALSGDSSADAVQLADETLARMEGAGVPPAVHALLMRDAEKPAAEAVILAQAAEMARRFDERLLDDIEARLLAADQPQPAIGNAKEGIPPTVTNSTIIAALSKTLTPA
jgi:hypothetical protein